MSEHLPGEAAPDHGAYEQTNIFGRPNGIRITVARGQMLPDAPVGHFWRRVDPDAEFVQAGQQQGPAQRSIDSYVGTRLRHLRWASGMSLAELGAEIGVSEASIAAYERGDERPSPREIVELVKLFGVGLSELFPENPGQITGKLH